MADFVWRCSCQLRCLRRNQRSRRHFRGDQRELRTVLGTDNIWEGRAWRQGGRRGSKKQRQRQRGCGGAAKCLPTERGHPQSRRGEANESMAGGEKRPLVHRRPSSIMRMVYQRTNGKMPCSVDGSACLVGGFWEKEGGGLHALKSAERQG